LYRSFDGHRLPIAVAFFGLALIGPQRQMLLVFAEVIVAQLGSCEFG
jgi:hypothetical protein